MEVMEAKERLLEETKGKTKEENASLDEGQSVLNKKEAEEEDFLQPYLHLLPPSLIELFRLDVIENKVATIELIENLDKKIHNQITQYGSNLGMVLKNLKEKEPTVNKKLGHDSARIGKLEDAITNLGSAFAAV
ncbi:Far1 [Hordeum vulgare]|nr:Far1 [Hordeum vulgare]